MHGLISFIGWIILTILSKSLRVKDINKRDWQKSGEGANVVFGFWHGEQCALLHHHRHQGVGIMSSLSKDGEIQAGILKRFGFNVVRGSSSRRGERALIELIRLLRKGLSIAYAVDGPKGPYHEAKPGVIFSAMKTGRPIIPVSTAPRHFKVLEKAWDKYELPLPFTKLVVAYGEPLYVKENDDVQEKALELQNRMKALSDFTHLRCWQGNIPQYLAHHPRPKILIIQPSRIGDVVFSLPTLSAIRSKYPNAWIGWVADERCAPIIEGNKDLDEVIVFDRRKVSIPYLLKFRRYLREKGIDLSIDLHGLFKSAFLVHFAGARFRIASSSTNGMRELSYLFSKEIKPSKAISHCVERHLAVASFLGCAQTAPKYSVAVADRERSAVKELLSKHGIAAGQKFAVIHPGGGWIARRWFPERFAELARLLDSEKIPVALVGGKEGGAGEKGLNEEIKSLSRAKLLDLTGVLSIKELAALFLECSLFIGNEAGPMHLAVALNTPSIALLGPTDPGRTGPFGGKTTIIRHEIECQPCRNRSCKKRTCMHMITVEEVFREALKVLKS